MPDSTSGWGSIFLKCLPSLALGTICWWQCWDTASGSPRIPIFTTAAKKPKSPVFTCNTKLYTQGHELGFAGSSQSPQESLLPVQRAREQATDRKAPNQTSISPTCLSLLPKFPANFPRRRGSVCWRRAIHLVFFFFFFACNASKGLIFRPCDSRAMAEAIGCLASKIATLVLIRDDPAAG